ncbi:hypothetical protein [Streptomyces sp. NBC_00343]|uniref:hypothetical protein n=1 Tax=Streptomyces sp. NBC_00343 TaxID=2975719 RepID=UPI003FA72021
MTVGPGVSVAQDSDASVIERSWEKPAAFAVLLDRHADSVHRYAAYEALAAVPGIKVLPHQKDANGRVGIGFQYVGPAGTPWAKCGTVLVFDAKTYRYLGMHDRRTAGGTTDEQRSYVAVNALVDRVMQRP